MTKNWKCPKCGYDCRPKAESRKPAVSPKLLPKLRVESWVVGWGPTPVMAN